MNVSITEVLKKNNNKRKQPYHYRAGDFVLTASFKKTQVNHALINLAGKLVKHYTIAEVSRIMGLSEYVVSKMNRCFVHSEVLRREG